MPPRVNPNEVKYIIPYQNMNYCLLQVVIISSHSGVHLLPSKRLN